MHDERRMRFEGLFRSHADAVLGYALRRTSPDEVDDVVAETFLIAWRRFDDIPANAGPWLLGVSVVLPRDLPRDDEASTPATESASWPAVASRDGRSVLIVDDDEGVRRLFAYEHEGLVPDVLALTKHFGGVADAAGQESIATDTKTSGGDSEPWFKT